MEGIKEKLTAKLGPFPVWVWAVIGLAVVLGYMYFSKSGIFGGSGSGDYTGTGAGGALDSTLGAGGSGGSIPTLPIQTPQGPGIQFTNGNSGSSPGTLASLLASDPSLPGANRGGTNFDPTYALGAGVDTARQNAVTRGGGQGQDNIPFLAAYNQGLRPAIVNYNPVRGRSSGTQAIA